DGGGTVPGSGTRSSLAAPRRAGLVQFGTIPRARRAFSGLPLAHITAALRRRPRADGRGGRRGLVSCLVVGCRAFLATDIPGNDAARQQARGTLRARRHGAADLGAARWAARGPRA